ncbi:non-ribosomal peptide synthetase [Cytobacillus horneckiae]|uniref:non-ribosomal peptide synthetase n=1 Tax=Cytobacillus horneckiae TaxID=549687 RepID=UPI0039A18E3D
MDIKNISPTLTKPLGQCLTNNASIMVNSIPDMFKEQVKATPNAIALSDNKEKFTYMQLDKITDNFAQVLLNHQIHLDNVVLIYAESSIKTIASILGVLKAGGCYLALEVDTVCDRLAYILEDASPSLVITTSDKANKFVEQSLIDLDEEWDKALETDVELQPVALSKDQLAYISYTSGTTGRPKGVCVTHGAVRRLVNGEQFLNLNSDTTFLQLAPLAFDASTLEVWGTLCNGGNLVVYPNEKVSPEVLEQVIDTHSINSLWLTAGLFHLMVDNNIEIFKNIANVLAGGDVISVQHVQKLMNKFPYIHFINGYGPTENTTFTSTWTADKELKDLTSVPIGKPINGTEVYILDSNLLPVKDEEIGSLYAGGEGLARCYLNMSKETAEKFIPNPFSHHHGQRMYDTGDLARWRNDGTIEFIGRADGQLKINGYRVETREIEELLKSHPDILDAIVLSQSCDQDKKLVAYVILKQCDCTDTSKSVELKNFLRERLPKYMIPWAISILKSFPLTKNGKVDRGLLPKLTFNSRNVHTEYTPPETALEIYLTELWEEFLKIDSIGVNDDFFELGGHSLIVAQLVSHIREDKKLNISSKILYLNPTIKKLASAIDS